MDILISMAQHARGGYDVYTVVGGYYSSHQHSMCMCAECIHYAPQPPEVRLVAAVQEILKESDIITEDPDAVANELRGMFRPEQIMDDEEDSREIYPESPEDDSRIPINQIHLSILIPD